jgi:hypothetical protein
MKKKFYWNYKKFLSQKNSKQAEKETKIEQNKKARKNLL